MNCIGTYDGTIFYNPANKFCIVSVKTADQSVPAEARSNRRYKDHLIRFTAVGYEIPRTDAVELELDGEWTKGKYGVQLQVEQWREIVPRTKNGVEGYLASGLIKGIGPKTAADIVERFGVDTLDMVRLCLILKSMSFAVPVLCNGFGNRKASIRKVIWQFGAGFPRWSKYGNPAYQN